jgi:hypothetical protein
MKTFTASWVKVFLVAGSFLLPGGAYGLSADMNCDGSVSFADINRFVMAITNPAAYAEQNPACDIMNADINCDGVVDFQDVNPFVQCIVQPGSCSSCEPQAPECTVGNYDYDLERNIDCSEQEPLCTYQSFCAARGPITPSFEAYKLESVDQQGHENWQPMNLDQEIEKGLRFQLNATHSTGPLAWALWETELYDDYFGVTAAYQLDAPHQMTLLAGADDCSYAEQPKTLQPSAGMQRLSSASGVPIILGAWDVQGNDFWGVGSGVHDRFVYLNLANPQNSIAPITIMDNSVIFPARPQGVALYQDKLIVSGHGTNGSQQYYKVYVYRADPNNFSLLKEFTDLEFGVPNAGGMAHIGNYLYVVSPFVTTGPQLFVVNIENPLAPQVIGSLAISPGQFIKEPLLVNDKALILGSFKQNTTYKFWIIDVRDPANPVIQQSISASALPYPVAASGNRFAHTGNPNGAIVELDIPEDLSQPISILNQQLVPFIPFFRASVAFEGPRYYGTELVYNNKYRLNKFDITDGRSADSYYLMERPETLSCSDPQLMLLHDPDGAGPQKPFLFVQVGGSYEAWDPGGL